jgi:predicted dehydrogenase
MNSKDMTRREFMRAGATAAAIGAGSKVEFLTPTFLQAAPRAVPPSDRIRFAQIGNGIRGSEDMRNALACPGTEVVAACDLYDGRLAWSQENAGKKLDTTKEYRKILDRKDIDAVIVAVPDHWHSKIVEDACAAGKDVYIEKPMTHKVEQGFSIIDAMNKYSRIIQVGSQRRSSIVYAKAKEIIDSGYLGQITAAECWVDRNDASGAWVYPIPPDANPQTIDWDTFLGPAPKRPFDLKRFFRWRCYQDYGEGLPGDLYVHLLTGVHFLMSVTAPPLRAASMGGLLRWTEDRDQPDLIWTLYEYPTFRLSLRCNLNNESAEMTRIFGTKGTLKIENDVLTATPQNTEPQPEGYSIYGWEIKTREQYLENWHKEHPLPEPGHYPLSESAMTFQAPPYYDYSIDHMNNFLESIRSRRPSAEDANYGNNTAIACHMANFSYFEKTIAVWDGDARKIVRA